MYKDLFWAVLVSHTIPSLPKTQPLPFFLPPGHGTYPPIQVRTGEGYPKVPTSLPRYLPLPMQVRAGRGEPQGTYLPAKIPTPPHPGQGRKGGTPRYLPPCPGQDGEGVPQGT